MSFIDLRFAAELLKQGFTRDDIMTMITGKSDTVPEPAPAVQETPPASVPEPAPAMQETPPASVPEPAPAVQASAEAHRRTEAKAETITFEQLLAQTS